MNFDTDGVTLIVNNLATCILSNDRLFLVGPLKPADTCFQTTSGFSSLQFVGTIQQRFLTDKGQTVSYNINDAIYDPDSGFNILGIPHFSAYMAKKLEKAKTTMMKLGSSWEQPTHRLEPPYTIRSAATVNLAKFRYVRSKNYGTRI